jgi:hypothetical protein
MYTTPLRAKRRYRCCSRRIRGPNSPNAQVFLGMKTKPSQHKISSSRPDRSMHYTINSTQKPPYAAYLQAIFFTLDSSDKSINDALNLGL